jgi:hypothetical protein
VRFSTPSAGFREIQQHRQDPAVGFPLLDEVELREERIDVLLDRTLREIQTPGDGVVRFAAGELFQNLPLAWREPFQLRQDSRRSPTVWTP